MYRVILADDEDEFREWLRLELGKDQAFQVVGEASDGTDAIRLATQTNPDLVIADVEMPESDGLEVARDLLARRPDIKVVLISAHTERGYEELARDAGVLAFIPKADFSVDALRRALQGGA